MTPVASPRPGPGLGPPWELPAAGRELRAARRTARARRGRAGRRTATSRGFRAESGRPAWLPSSGPTRRSAGPRWPAQARAAGLWSRVRARPRSARTMSALQRGWQEGRSQRMADAESGPSGADRQMAAEPTIRPRTRRHVEAPMDHDAGAAGQVGQLDWLLDDLVRRVGHVSKAVILSQDGIALGASETLERDDAEHLAALAAGFQSLARGAGTALRRRRRGPADDHRDGNRASCWCRPRAAARASPSSPSKAPTSAWWPTRWPSWSAGPGSTSRSTRARPHSAAGFKRHHAVQR